MSPTKCASHHFGPWAIEPEWFKSAVASVQSGIMRAEGQSEQPQDGEAARYENRNGTAFISIAGPMMKIRSKFGGTSTVDARNAIRKAAEDPSVESIMLVIDSPGGTVAGTDALAADVREANRKKPVHAHIEDMGASAAYWIASQARRVTASPTSLVGSLGARMSVIDSSSYFAKNGVKVHEIASGEFKGAGADGTEVTDRQLAYFQGLIDEAASHFKGAVQFGRGFTAAEADALFDGKVHDAAKANELGLIDSVSTLDAAMAALQQETHRMNMESFKAFAADHPEAVATFIEQGQKQGIKLGQNATIAMIEAFPNRVQFAIEQIKAGRTIEEAKEIVAVIDSETAEAKAASDKAKAEADAKVAAAQAEADAKIAAHKAEIEKLKAEIGTQSPVGVKPKVESTPVIPEFTEGTDPKAHAAAEWEADKALADSFASKDVYVAYRAAELSGRARINKPMRQQS